VVLGKWAAVVSVSLLIAALSSISFLPGQWLLRSEVLSAMFRYGPAEALAFVALLFPLACTLSALLMAVAIRCRSFKEAQARATVLMLGSSLLPLVAVFSRDGSSAWHYWLPALAQTTLMGQVLKGESLSFALVMPSLAVCGLLTGLALGYVARVLGQAALG
jgi:sodium transport system permease protein